ncbi:MAG: hypothetical protein JOZ69_12835 [Myxococcales bacterium]|nr:hypothetical protein [Myxococcales bacterium]
MISVMASFSLHADGIHEDQGIPVRSSSAMWLLGRSVRLAEGRRDGTLTLTLDGDATLAYRDDSPHYESYQIQIGSREIRV